ncbi:MAG: serine hydrolase domain-containing protein [Planctomycetota bacterium]
MIRPYLFLLLITGIAHAQDDDPLSRRGLAVERFVSTTTPAAIDAFIQEHLSESFGAGRDRGQVRSQLEEIRQRCRNAGGVMLEPHGDSGLRIVFEYPDRRQAVLIGLEPSAPHRITSLELKEAPEAESGPAVAPMSWSTLAQRLDQEEASGFAGVVLAAKDGKIVHHEAYGLADQRRKIPNTTETIFAIGSTPIDFTHGAILKLAEEGKLALQDPISKYLSGVPSDKQSITIEHLRTSRSGFQNFPGIPGVDEDLDLSWIDREEFLSRMMKSELLFAPGQGQAHSHAAWGILTAIVEVVSGQSYEDYLQETFFGPAGMTRTGSYSFTHQFDPAEVAVGYGSNRIRPTNSPVHWGRTSWLVKGSGGMVSTPMDLYRWNRFVRGGQVLSKESTKLYGSGGLAAGANDRGFLCLYNTDLETLVIVCSNVHEGPRDFAERVAEAAVRVAMR